MAQIILTQYDKGIDLDFIVRDSACRPLNILGLTIKFQLADEHYNNVINADCVITDAPNGKCTYRLAGDDLDLPPGFYKGALEVNYSASKIVSSTQFDVKIIPQCG